MSQGLIFIVCYWIQMASWIWHSRFLLQVTLPAVLNTYVHDLIGIPMVAILCVPYKWCFCRQCGCAQIWRTLGWTEVTLVNLRRGWDGLNFKLFLQTSKDVWELKSYQHYMEILPDCHTACNLVIANKIIINCGNGMPTLLSLLVVRINSTMMDPLFNQVRYGNLEICNFGKFIINLGGILFLNHKSYVI